MCWHKKEIKMRKLWTTAIVGTMKEAMRNELNPNGKIGMESKPDNQKDTNSGARLCKIAIKKANQAQSLVLKVLQSVAKLMSSYAQINTKKSTLIPSKKMGKHK